MSAQAAASFEEPLEPTDGLDIDPRRRAYFAQLEHAKPGFLLGAWVNPYRGDPVYLADRSDRFLGMFSPTRWGKGVSFAIPNALSWEHSLFANDPKRELCQATAWWRKHALGQRIFIVDPMATDGRNARFNALSEIRVRTEHEIQDALSTATAIVDPDGSGFDGEPGIWKKRARDLLAALVLHVLYAPQYPEKSLRTIAAFLTEPRRSLKDKFGEMISTIHDLEDVFGWVDFRGTHVRTHPFIASAAQEQLDRPEGEAGSVKSEVQSYLNCYRDNKLGANSAVSDFAIADVMRGPVPATVYLVVNPDSMETCKPYIRLFLNLLINRNVGPLSFDASARPVKPYRWKLGLLLDEFTSTLGNLQIFSKQLAFIAGYGLKPAVIVQDIQQLQETYGRLENITSNLHTFIIGAMNNLQSAEFFSRMLGRRTYHYESVSHSRGGKSRSDHADSISLISPEQMLRLPMDECIARIGHMHPIPLKRILYYDQDSGFAQRVRNCDFASDRIPAEAQTGYAQRLADERTYRDLAASRAELTLAPTSGPAEAEQLATARSMELAFEAADAEVANG